MEENKITVAALYKFTAFENYEDYRDKIRNNMEENGVKGTLLIAKEGINGTIAGTKEGINNVLEYLRSIPEIGDFGYKFSYAKEMPFNRTKVKLKKEIVTMGVDNIDPTVQAGKYIKPKDWNKLISDPDVLLVDTRNEYEVKIGTFKNAVNPHIETFKEFPEVLDKQVKEKKPKKIAMFCTGGIRCEKSTSYLTQQGFDEVYHLEGGILKYLEEVPEEESLWEGDCFVFDNRISVKHNLELGEYDQCFACRMPITEEEKQSEHYEPGKSCVYCYDKKTKEQIERYAERQEQINLAKEKGLHHLGGEVKEEIKQRKEEKKAYKESQRSLDID